MGKMEASFKAKAFIAIGVIFSLSSSFNLAKTLRDRIDAGVWKEYGHAQRANVFTVARGTYSNAIQIWAFFAVSLAGTLAGLATLDMAIELRGFFGMGLLFMT